MKSSCAELLDLGFSVAQISVIAGHNGGSKNIEAVKESFSTLRDLGYTIAQIANMAGNIGGGSKKIEVFKKTAYKLCQS